MKAVGAAVLLTVASLLAKSLVVSGSGDPILLVPGLMGSQLDVLDGGEDCNTGGKNESLWISGFRFIRFSCFKSEMTLKFNSKNGHFSNKHDYVKVTAPGFGGTKTVEDLGQDFIRFSYFEDLVSYFEQRGYESGKSIRGAPYDWRLGPVELKRRGYFDNLKSLVEEMYQANGNTKVTIVAHSMGAPTMLYFFTQSEIIDQSWKDMYIGNFITLSGAWSGGNQVLRADISGLSADEGLFEPIRELSSAILRSLIPILRTFQSIYFLLPRPSVWGNTVIVSTPTQTYTTNDYERLFSDIGLADGYAKYQGVEKINENYPAPNVPTHCFYGVGVDTPLSFTYKESFPKGADSVPDVTTGNGDGSVNTPSSEVCLRWANSGHTFNHKTFRGVNHRNIVKDDSVLKEIRKIVGAKQSLWDRVLDLFG